MLAHAARAENTKEKITLTSDMRKENHFGDSPVVNQVTLIFNDYMAPT